MSNRIKTILLSVLGIFCLACASVGLSACEHTHTFESVAAKEATCTEDGNIACYHCTDCGNYYTDEEAYHYVTSEEVVIPALGHNFVDNVCTRCGQYESSVHEHGELYKVDAKEATCTEYGRSEYWVCLVCGNHYADEYGLTQITDADSLIAPLGHDCGEYGYCVRCGITDPEFTAEASEGLEYELSEDGTYYSVSFGLDCTDTDIVIPETYNGKTVSAIDGWGFASEAITSIYIPASITSIGEGAFYSCPLKSILVADDNEYYMSYFGNLYNKSGTTLIRYASGNPAASYEIESTVARLEDYAFTNSDNLVSITIPASVTYIGLWCFAFCDNLDNVVIPDSVTSIGDGLFDECISLTSVTISSSLTAIGAYMFYNNYSLVTVKIPDGVTAIEAFAFAECTALVNVIIPASVTEIGEAAFENCLSLTEIYYTGTSEQFDKISENFDGVEACVYYYSATMPDGEAEEYNYWYYTADGIAQTWSYYATEGLTYTLSDDKTYYIVSGYNGTDTDIYIPSQYEGLTVKEIGGYAFLRKDITSIYIPDAVTTISSTAFVQCASLEYVYIGSGVKDIPAETFSGCTALSWFEVSARNTVYQSMDGDIYTIDGVTLVKYAVGKINTSAIITALEIGTYAFYGSPYLTSVTISAALVIHEYAFWGCAALETVIIDIKFLSIGEYAFYGCSKLAAVYYLGTETMLSAIDIKANNDPLYNSTIYFYSESIPTATSGNYWHYSNGEPKIWSFTATEGLIYSTYTTDSDGVKCVEVTGYSGTETDIVIPDTYGEYVVDGIYPAAFQNNTSITSVRIGNNVKSIGMNSFYCCTALTDVLIGSSVHTIEYFAFYGCTSLKSITIPDSVVIIGTYAFYLCESVTDIVIGDGVETIGDNAFGYCAAAKNVTLGNSVEEIGGSAFCECDMPSITIPRSVTYIGGKAFSSTLLDIYYQGTEEEWNAIEKEENAIPSITTIHYNAQ